MHTAAKINNLEIAVSLHLNSEPEPRSHLFFSRKDPAHIQTHSVVVFPCKQANSDLICYQEVLMHVTGVVTPDVYPWTLAHGLAD